MPVSIPPGIDGESVARLILSLADDELILGHRLSEWTGHAPILEEDLALSNIAQDELGHSLVWYSLLEQVTGIQPDEAGFRRPPGEFSCCHFVAYPKGDFAYTMVRQYLFDVAEKVRLTSFLSGSLLPLKDIAGKLLREEEYHLLHTGGMVERLGSSTEESHRRMQDAVHTGFPQALGLFEILHDEHALIKAGIFPGNHELRDQWLGSVVPFLRRCGLDVPVTEANGSIALACAPDEGGRQRKHTAHLHQVVEDLQAVVRIAPEAKW